MNTENQNSLCAWTESREHLGGLVRIDNNKHLSDYVEKINEARRERGQEPIEVHTGTIADYEKARKDFNRATDRKHADEYKASVNEEQDKHRRCISALEKVKDVVRRFDGKVLNKRFTDAVNTATGFHADIFNHFSLCDWSRSRCEVSVSLWQWYTGDRLEADKAIEAIDHEITTLREDIEVLEATKKQYLEYLKKCNKIADLIEELDAYDYRLRQFAKTNYHFKSWKTYLAR